MEFCLEVCPNPVFLGREPVFKPWVSIGFPVVYRWYLPDEFGFGVAQTPVNEVGKPFMHLFWKGTFLLSWTKTTGFPVLRQGPTYCVYINRLDLQYLIHDNLDT